MLWKSQNVMSNNILKKSQKISGQKSFPKKSKEIEKEMSWEKQVKTYLGKKISKEMLGRKRF